LPTNKPILAIVQNSGHKADTEFDHSIEFPLTPPKETTPLHEKLK